MGIVTFTFSSCPKHALWVAISGNLAGQASLWQIRKEFTTIRPDIIKLKNKFKLAQEKRQQNGSQNYLRIAALKGPIMTTKVVRLSNKMALQIITPCCWAYDVMSKIPMLTWTSRFSPDMSSVVILTELETELVTEDLRLQSE